MKTGLKYGDKVYYCDELHDEVVDFRIKKKPIDENYCYERKGFFYRLGNFITYRLFLIPVIGIYKFFASVRVKNRQVLKKVKGAYFLYGNHTNQLWDAFTPTFVTFPKQPYLIVGADNVSQPVLGYFTKMWGALPLPENFQAAKNFKRALDHKIQKGSPVVIYPEEHMWPYYTKIRPFEDKSFTYPVKYNVPMFTLTTTYRKRKLGKKPRMDVYVDGPFYPDQNLDPKVAQKQLRDIAHQTMCARAERSNYEYLTYVKKEKHD